MNIWRLFFTSVLFFAFSWPISAQWIKQNVETKASFRGLSVVSEKIVWASGTGGTVIKTLDGGKTWKINTVSGAEKLDFRDIEAFDANTAYILSIGNGESSRIYKTTDGGANWKLQFKNTNEKAFFDAIACWDRNNCIAMSDPVDNKFVLISTKDGGQSWNPIDTTKMPPTKDGEAAFAASGTCLITQGKSNAFLVTGGTAARVFRSTDRGMSWSVSDTPIVHGTAGSGIFSIAMNGKNGVIVGGNYESPDQRFNTFAMTHDGGSTWQLGAALNGYRSGAVYLDRETVLAVGTSGADASYSRCLPWENLGSDNLNAVAAKGKNAVWAVGPRGNVALLKPTAISNASKVDPKSFDGGDLPPSVTVLNLSHVEISSNCAPSDTRCSSKRRISVLTTAVAPEASSFEYAYTVSAGKIIGDGAHVEWDLSNVPPGKHFITAGINMPYLRCMAWGALGKTQTQEILIK
jgi:photosystem II stability/assembly factor-like uncharacterized protein